MRRCLAVVDNSFDNRKTQTKPASTHLYKLHTAFLDFREVSSTSNPSKWR